MAIICANCLAFTILIYVNDAMWTVKVIFTIINIDRSIKACLTLEIQVMTWIGHKNVTGLNPVIAISILPFLIIGSPTAMTTIKKYLHRFD